LGNNDQLDPRLIGDWVNQRRAAAPAVERLESLQIYADLARPLEVYLHRRITVAPAETGARISWIDSAGYVVARSDRPARWPQVPNDFLFELDVPGSTVTGERYQPRT
jgi:hypothetical protein